MATSENIVIQRTGTMPGHHGTFIVREVLTEDGGKRAEFCVETMHADPFWAVLPRAVRPLIAWDRRVGEDGMTVCGDVLRIAEDGATIVRRSCCETPRGCGEVLEETVRAIEDEHLFALMRASADYPGMVEMCESALDGNATDRANLRAALRSAGILQ